MNDRKKYEGITGVRRAPAQPEQRIPRQTFRLAAHVVVLMGAIATPLLVAGCEPDAASNLINNDPNAAHCSPNPCLHGAMCTGTNESYACTCAAGYTGQNCETNIDDCAPNPCLGGSACTDGVNNYSCVCGAGFTGKSCETNIDDCAPNPCQNGGACTDGVDSFTCQCSSGFGGADCSLPCTPDYATWSSTRNKSNMLNSDQRTATSTADLSWVQSNVCKSSGKWYVEVIKTVDAPPYAKYWAVGVASLEATTFNGGTYANDVSSIFYYAGGPGGASIDKQTAYNPDAIETQIMLDVVGLKGVIGIALDMDSRQIRFHTPGQAAGTWAGPYALPGSAANYCIHYGYGHGNALRINAGQDPFVYTVPVGHTAGLYVSATAVCP